MTTTNVLITGCNRGIGKGLLTEYLSRENHTVIGTVRDLSSSTTTALQSIPKPSSTKLIILKLDSSSQTDAQEAISSLKSEHHVSHLNIVIANAGISNYFGSARETPAEEMLSHYTVNTLGPLLLFQAVAPLLDASSPTTPKFIIMSSGAGSIAGTEKLKVANTAYGASKCAANFVARKIHMENEGLICFPINPGWLATELGNHAAVSSGLERAPVSVEDGVKGVVAKIDAATREGMSGRFVNGQGEEFLDW